MLYVLCKGVFHGIGQALGLVIGNVPNAQHLEDLEEGLAVVPKGHGPMVGIALLKQQIVNSLFERGNA